MKKQYKIILLVIAAALLTASLFLLGGCGKNDVQPPEPDEEKSDVPDEPAPVEPEKEPTPEEKAAISERAMQNFIDKITGGNYVMDADGYLKTTVYSEDLVLFDYADDSAYTDFAVMSVSDEVFQGFFENNGVGDVVFLKEGKAIDASTPKLPTNWLTEEMSDGNIYNVFYNDTEEPLRFASYDMNIQNQVRMFAGYGDIALNYMHEVYLVLDQEDPTVAHIQAVVDDNETARYYFDDIDIVITFGEAQSDARAESWMKAPVYPEARTGWTETDVFIFDSVFLPGYGEQAIPYMPFASYALSVDGERFVYEDTVYIRDPHATQADLDSYAEQLLNDGFEAAEENGVTSYRRLLREETNCYSSITLEYDDGLNAAARKYYDFPRYEGLDEINAVVTANGYPAIPETEALTDLTATDTKDEQTESWLYFYDYDTVLYVYANYEDADAVTDYLDGYLTEFEGYYPVYVDGEDGEIDHYRSENGARTFRYHFNDDGETVILLYKAEKCLSASELQTILAGEGFPEIDLSAVDTARDHTKFNKVMYGRDYGAAVSISMSFDTVEAAEEFLDNYVADLEGDDFMRVPPGGMSTNKNNAYTNEETGLGVAFDLFPGENGKPTIINFEFKSGIDFESEESEEGDEPILGVAFDIVEDADGAKRLAVPGLKAGL